jgi:hypothetical protein
MRPRLQSGAGARPLNFTVRSHLGNRCSAKRKSAPSLFDSARYWRHRTRDSAGVFDRRNRVRVRLLVASIEVWARAPIEFVKQQARLVRCAPGAERLRYSVWGALNWQTMLPLVCGGGAARAQWWSVW